MDLPKYSWVFLTVVISLATVNQTQRFSIAYIVSSGEILSDTKTSSLEYGILTGPSFLMTCAICALPFVMYMKGRLVDYLPRLKLFLLVISIASSVSTGLTALASDFIGLLWPRMLFAIFSSGLDPVFVRLLALYFPPESRGIAFGFMILSVYAGSGIASITLVMDMYLGWRWTFVALGIAGVVMTIAAAFVLKDEKNEERNPRFNLTSDFRELIKNNSLLLCTLATTVRYAGGFSRGFFEALFFTDRYPDNRTLYSVLNGVFVALAPVSLLAMGRYSDKIEVNGLVKIKPVICIVTSFIPVPFLYLMYNLDNFSVAMVCLFCVYFFGEVYNSLCFAIMINVTTPTVRALQAALLVFVSYSGSSISLLVLGSIDSDNSDLRTGLIAIVPTCYVIGGLLFFWLSRVYTKDYQKANYCTLIEDEMGEDSVQQELT